VAHRVATASAEEKRAAIANGLGSCSELPKVAAQVRARSVATPRSETACINERGGVVARRYVRSGTTAVEPLADCLYQGDEQVMQALATVGALVARADGRIDVVERDELVNFVDRQLPTISAHQIADAFDNVARQLEDRDSGYIVAQALGPLADPSLASVVVRAAERVAAADLQIHSGELEAIKLIRQIMIAVSSRRPATSPHSALAEIIFFFAVVAAASIAISAAMILPVMNELTPWTGSQKMIVVSPRDNDNYLELFAKGPGRGWYVLGKAHEAPPMKPMGSNRISEPEIGAHDSSPEVARETIGGPLDPHIPSPKE
jgi:tellurite resistance protein